MERKSKKSRLEKFLLGFLGLSAITAGWLLYLNFKPPVTRNSKFMKKEHAKELKYFTAVDIDGDGSADAVAAYYDLNKNGKPDAIGFFAIDYQYENTVYTKPYASIVFIDKNEDGNLDYALIDKDNNGTLETKIKLDNNYFQGKKENFNYYDYQHKNKSYML